MPSPFSIPDKLLQQFNISKDYNIKEYNTFGISAKAAYFVKVQDLKTLEALLQEDFMESMPFLVLGGGSNLLFLDDFDGLVILNELRGVEKIAEDASTVRVRVAAGHQWHDFVLTCIENQWAGLENLSLIPGTCGAAPIQNIGAYGVEQADCFIQLNAIDLKNKKSVTFDKHKANFGYRDSYFKQHRDEAYFITSIDYLLTKNRFKVHLSYGGIQAQLASKSIDAPDIRQVSDAVIAIRQQKLPDPRQEGNAGSFFKNPEIPTAHLNQIREKFPEVPFYELGHDSYKIPAAWLIEKSGWKGRQLGNAATHHRQPLVMVNKGVESGREVLKLALEVRKAVAQNFGIVLENEVNLVNKLGIVSIDKA